MRAQKAWRSGYANAVNHWYDYGGANRIASITNDEGGSIVSGYGYDDLGNRNVWNNAGVIVTYQFDDNGRVLAGQWTEGSDAWTSSWSYDNAGNLTNYVTRKNGQVQTELRNQYSENNFTTYRAFRLLQSFESRHGRGAMVRDSDLPCVERYCLVTARARYHYAYRP